jgi:hypothetical protein
LRLFAHNWRVRPCAGDCVEGLNLMSVAVAGMGPYAKVSPSGRARAAFVQDTAVCDEGVRRGQRAEVRGRGSEFSRRGRSHEEGH